MSKTRRYVPGATADLLRQRAHAAIRIGFAAADELPSLGAGSFLEHDRDAGSRMMCEIEDVRRNRHGCPRIIRRETRSARCPRSAFGDPLSGSGDQTPSGLSCTPALIEDDLPTQNRREHAPAEQHARVRRH